MSLLQWCEWMQDLPTSTAIRESQFTYPAIETVHVLSMALFLGLVFMMDLRLAGIGNMRTPFTQIQKRLFPLQLIGMIVSGITGVVLVFADPVRFYTNIFFWLKIGGLALATLNLLAFHFTTYHSVALWDDGMPPLRGRIAGFLSLVLWSAVVISGRLIAYNWFK
jgi:hypothetical protein